MKNKISVTVLFATIVFLSCNKDNSSPNNGNGQSLPKTYTEDIRSSIVGNSLTTYTLSYDGNNRLLTLVSTPAPPLLSFQYKYSGSTVTLDLYNSGALNIHENFWLNSNSLVDSTFQYNNTNDTTAEKYIYNANKLLTELKEYAYHSTGSSINSITDYTYDANGNTLTEVDNIGNSKTYDYYLDLVNPLSLGQPYYPQTKNLVKTASITSGGTTETATHFYTFDGNKRLTKDSIASSNNIVTVIKSYTY